MTNCPISSTYLCRLIHMQFVIKIIIKSVLRDNYKNWYAVNYLHIMEISCAVNRESDYFLIGLLLIFSINFSNSET